MNFKPDVPGLASLDSPCALSIVVPAYNEEDVLPIFHTRLVASLPDGTACVFDANHFLRPRTKSRR